VARTVALSRNPPQSTHGQPRRVGFSGDGVLWPSCPQVVKRSSRALPSIADAVKGRTLFWSRTVHDGRGLDATHCSLQGGVVGERHRPMACGLTVARLGTLPLLKHPNVPVRRKCPVRRTWQQKRAAACAFCTSASSCRRRRSCGSKMADGSFRCRPTPRCAARPSGVRWLVQFDGTAARAGAAAFERQPWVGDFTQTGVAQAQSGPCRPPCVLMCAQRKIPLEGSLIVSQCDEESPRIESLDANGKRRYRPDTRTGFAAAEWR
jgi:hypothetical protein